MEPTAETEDSAAVGVAAPRTCSLSGETPTPARPAPQPKASEERLAPRQHFLTSPCQETAASARRRATSSTPEDPAGNLPTTAWRRSERRVRARARIR